MEHEIKEADLQLENQALKEQLEEYKDLIESIRTGKVDALAIRKNGQPNILTLESTDFIYRVLVENLAESALNVTETGMILYANAAFESLLGASNSSIIGSDLKSLIDPLWQNDFKKLFNAAFSGVSKGETILLYEGNKIPVYVSFSSLYPRFSGIGIIITDLSEKKKQEKILTLYKDKLSVKEEEMILAENSHLRQAKEKLEEHAANIEKKNNELTKANIELGSFTYIASHDLKEPLRKINMMSSRILLKQGDDFLPEVTGYFQSILSTVGYMQNLIDGLLSYSSINNNQLKLVDTDLNLIISQVKNNLESSILEKGVIIETVNLPTLKIIAIPFIQLFTNLISNAVKYSRENVFPVIKIEARLVAAEDIETEQVLSASSYWQIMVKDNGIGFDQKYQYKIFELFQRLHEKDTYTGTGIGLAICSKIVQNHGGFITAYGEPGVGSIFSVFQPVEAVEQEVIA
ncbi:MAG: sensor histidine kinase [Bacteroidetes bacterium]|nr:sensor histidine kinase [Bacteroidota bacterium]